MTRKYESQSKTVQTLEFCAEPKCLVASRVEVGDVGGWRKDTEDVDVGTARRVMRRFLQLVADFERLLSVTGLVASSSSDSDSIRE